MYLNTTVLIPKVKGITTRTQGERTYVLYETGREYNPNKQYSNVKRIVIGVRDSIRPEMMLPNENYLKVFLPAMGTAGTEKQEMLEQFETERQRRYMLRDHFLGLFYEFQMMSRKNPDGIVNRDKVRRLNGVLGPLMEMMKDEASAVFLEKIPEPEETEKDGEILIRGKSYSDISLLMTQFKSTVTRYFQNQF